MDYKNTLNLPRTDFSMKADLVVREPERLAKWEKQDLYAKIQAARATAPKFVLHDGPPFANGDVHIGTALNKILKDVIIKYKTLRGFSAPYIPGWDCHGLPIEFKVTQEMRKAGDTSADAATIRKACEAYARKYIDLQRSQFKRLGVLGDWEHPYLTLNKEYEADELRLFADIVEKGFVYRGKKPVYWSIPCRTALAEAEVEYQDHVSQSIYVKFPLAGWSKTFVVIWTTTPWTLPANLAVAYHREFKYLLVKVENETYILAEALFESVRSKCDWKSYRIVGELRGEALSGLKYTHPFIPRRKGKFYEADFVDSQTGTGFVHIAPGHGREDYLLGQAVGIKEVYSPVDDDGRLSYTSDFPIEKQMPSQLIGKSILEKAGASEANEAVLSLLKEKRVLLFHEPYSHSYPHCWRSKTPVIFRAMDQWFIKIDHIEEPGFYAGGLNMKTGRFRTSVPTFRDKALLEIDRVKWVPDWGVNRIKAAVESRPDWCISRQRTWGVPIPAFYEANGVPVLDAQIVRNTANLIEQHGSNIWFEKSVSELWALVKPANSTSAEPTAKSHDTLDVWIDSGSSSRAVIARRPEISGKDKPFQCDVYLEGSDQHRGWFQSSLLLSLAGNGAAPFKTVLTHGFMVDADREKISKSKQGQGGYEKPQTADAYVKKYGADVVRLWVASQDYRSDIVVSEERINKVSETYRGIRNTLRYQLSNLYDFDSAKHTVSDDKLTLLDRWILGQFADLEKQVVAAYDNYEFHVVYQKISQFVAVELSSIYHDVVKDRLYTDAANSQRRRSTQTALHRIVNGLCKMLAPILAFTSDEAWEFIPGQEPTSVVEAKWDVAPFVCSEVEEGVWKTLFGLRTEASPELEKQRQAKTIGKALDAMLFFKLRDSDLAIATEYHIELAEICGVSAVRIEQAPPVTELKTDVGSLEIDMNARVIARAARGYNREKCERCWHFETDIGSHADHPTLCGRCVEAVKQATT